jgi:MFS family permease
MTSLDSPPLMVSLVQVAASLPMFLFAIPAGALADIVDRRRDPCAKMLFADVGIQLGVTGRVTFLASSEAPQFIGFPWPMQFHPWQLLISIAIIGNMDTPDVFLGGPYFEQQSQCAID